MRSFFGWVVGSIFFAFWCQLGLILGPKTHPKWSQVGSEIDQTWIIDLRAALLQKLARIFQICQHNLRCPRARMYCKKPTLFMIFAFWLLCCFVDF